MSSSRSQRSTAGKKKAATTTSSTTGSSKKKSSRRYSSSTEEGEDQGNDDGSVFSLLGDSSSFVTPAKTPANNSQRSQTAPAATPGTGESTASAKARRKNATRSNQRGLPVPDQKFIAEELESEGGGLEEVLSKPSGLTNFLNQQAEKDELRKEFYGEYGSQTRSRIENKIRNWSRLGPAEYQRILVGFQVWPAAQRNGPTPQAVYSTPKLEPAYSSPTPEPAPSSAFKPPSVVKINKAAPPSGDFKTFRTPKKDLSSSDEEDNKKAKKPSAQSFVGNMSSEEGKRLAAENGKFSPCCAALFA